MSVKLVSQDKSTDSIYRRWDNRATIPRPNITNLEANLEQYKIDQAALHSEAAEQRALLQETIDKNKVDADRQFAEIMNNIYVYGLQHRGQEVVGIVTATPDGILKFVTGVGLVYEVSNQSKLDQ
ncbi:amidophosphoribosyltransferase [Artemisia annua]|uniref:Amidophosphoribosyltransferase n=1 Tax=Artemisia annua TaxID=35608 RepID=A0A2U1PUG2_ARTAN|nr:amidophosphoribosyltransferase [Artemisia annua]